MSSLFCQILNSSEQKTFFNKVPIFDEMISSASSSLALLILERMLLISSTFEKSLLNKSCWSLFRASNNFNFLGLPLFFLTGNVFILMGSMAELSDDCPSDPFVFFRASAKADLNLGADDLPLNSFQFSSLKSFIQSLFISALKYIYSNNFHRVQWTPY